MKNNKGFTLVELLATIIILAIVVGLGSYAITNIIRAAKEKNYNLLVGNIKDGSEQLYQECRYSGIEDLCERNQSSYTVTLGDLVSYGFLKGNSTKEDDTYTIVNPSVDDSDPNKVISNCSIVITFSNGKINVVNNGNTNPNCPTDCDYSGDCSTDEDNADEDNSD